MQYISYSSKKERYNFFFFDLMIFSLDIFENTSTVVVFHSWFQFDLDSFGLCCLLEDDRGAKSLIFSYLQTNGSSTGNGERVSSQFGTLFGLLLGLAILGQVEGSDFLCFLNLFLVGLDLLLEFSGQFRHAVLVLVVFIQLELELLDAALS